MKIDAKIVWSKEIKEKNPSLLTNEVIAIDTDYVDSENELESAIENEVWRKHKIMLYPKEVREVTTNFNEIIDYITNELGD